VKLSIVIPAYNEETTLQQVLEQIAAVLEATGLAYDVIVVDDGSIDGTWALLERLVSVDVWCERLRGVRFSRNFGKEAAIVSGLQHAGGDAVIVMDADLQHPPALIPNMVDLWSRGSYMVVEGVKRSRQRESLPRRLSVRLFYRILRFGAALDLRNSTDFKLLDRRVVDTYLQLPETGRFFRGLTTWMGWPTAQLEIAIPERTGGTTKWRFSALVDFARGSVVSFTALPLRLISWFGFAGLLLSVVLTIQTLLNKWSGASEVGFPTVIILILGMGSLILISLGIIGEYLSQLYNEVKRRPPYVVRDTLPQQIGEVSRASACGVLNDTRKGSG
jgi:glycosyltransferase involved in cell wall biosynthesis